MCRGLGVGVGVSGTLSGKSRKPKGYPVYKTRLDQRALGFGIESAKADFVNLDR